MEMDKLHIRSISDTPIIDTNDNKNTVSGYAFKYGTESQDLGGYIETIEQGALTTDILKKSDVFCFINHDENLVCARRRFDRGKLKLTIDDIGLKYEFQLNDKSPIHNQLRQYLEDEIITKSSFAFTIDDYEWVNNADGTEYTDENGLHRLKIKRFAQIFDCSPVFEPAYQNTSSELRSNDSVNSEILDELNIRKANVNHTRQNQLDQYYKKIRKKYRIKCTK